MSVAVAERPPWLEVVGILVGCLVLLVVIARMDASAHRQATERALVAIAEREQAIERRYGHIRDASDTLRASVGATAPARTREPQRTPMIWLVVLGGAGIALAGSGARILLRG